MTTLAPNTRTRTTFVYSFDEPAPGGRELLGGKGLGLSEMAHLGVPVPAGFTITTDACRAYMTNGGDLPAGLEDEILEHIERLERVTGSTFGDPVESTARLGPVGRCDLDAGDDGHDPRSRPERRGGAWIGCRHRQRAVRTRLLPAADPDVWRGRRRHRLSPVRGGARRAPDAVRRPERRRSHRVGSRARDRALQADLRGGRRTRASRWTRASSSCAQCWPCSSRGTRRERCVYRHTYEIPDDLGTAVNVMQMVFGNKGEDCGTGVCFSRDPSTGARGICGEFLLNAQGEDVVAGIRLPVPLEEMRTAVPGRLRPARADGRAARAALPRHPGHRVHGGAGSAVPPADPVGEANGGGLRQGGGRDGRGGAAEPRRRDRQNRARPARPPSPPDARSERHLRRRRERPGRLSGSCIGPRGLRRRHRRVVGPCRQGRDPRSLGDEPGRHPRPDRGKGHSHRPRRHRLARRAGRARDGQALRRRLRRADDRARPPGRDDRRPRRRRGRHDHRRRQQPAR